MYPKYKIDNIVLFRIIFWIKFLNNLLNNQRLKSEKLLQTAAFADFNCKRQVKCEAYRKDLCG